LVNIIGIPVEIFQVSKKRYGSVPSGEIALADILCVVLLEIAQRIEVGTSREVFLDKPNLILPEDLLI
jgi:hypothetical protein